VTAPLWLLLAPLAWGALWLLERWRRQPLRLVVADLGLFAGEAGDAPPPRAARRPSESFWWRAAACGALALAAAGPQWTREGRLDVDLVLDRGIESGFRVDGATSLDWHRSELLRVVDALRGDDRVHLHLVPAQGGIPPLSPSEARRVLTRTASSAAQGDVHAAVRALPGRRPAFVASPSAGETAGVAQARWVVRQPNRGVATVAVSEAGVEVALVGDGLPGPCELELEVDAGGVTHTKRVAVALPERGTALARWPRGEWPFAGDPERVAARLLGGDALPLDDRGFALRERRTRVALACDPGPAVERALRAVPGVELARAADLEASAFDLLIVERLASDAPLPPTAVVVVPAAGEEHAPVAARASVDPAGAFAHTVDAVFEAPFSVRQRAPLPSLDGAHPLLQTADGAPLVLVRGSGRRLVAALGVPPRREATSWVDSRAFPFFWAELVALASEARGRVRSQVAGTLRVDGEAVLDVGVFPAGEPRVGTVAAPLPLRGEGAPPAPFAREALVGLEGARPREHTSWAWLCFLLAAGLGLGGWLRSGARGRG